MQDVVGEVKLLLSLDGGSSKRQFAPLNAGEAPAYLYCQDGKLMLHATEPVAAFDIVLDGISSLEASNEMKNRGMVYALKEIPGGCHVLGYSLDGGYIPEGGVVLGSFEGCGARILSAVLSDMKACKLGVSLNSQPTGVAGMQVRGLDVEVVNGNVIIRTNESMRDVTWTIVTMDGKLVGKGVMPLLEPGRHIVSHGIHGMAIVTVKADGVNITKKINP